MIAARGTSKTETGPTPRAARHDADWYKDALFYELSIKSFFDSNHDGIGDLPGLTQKLDYLQDLGVNCLWLLPFFPSPWRDDGYDVADFRGVHPAYGTVRDFEQFLEEAHRRGLRVVAELAVNHTSDQHPWFQAARAAPPGSPLRDFYLWSETPDRFRDASVLYADAARSNWTWDPLARAYYWHRFFEYQPDLNYDNPAVRAEMVKVVRFWFDRGLDGLCLGGVSYLIEREGTTCENLPETHALLKELRTAVDAAYPGRMLLAGVNGWPADVRPYFGRGDECHTAPHLPLAQRLFLALRQEERHPVEDILRQTPVIPDNCQWVLLLRNHDELMLSLATDEERDYMYREYAADPRMRLHAGIRRRLAPLVGNSRRRLELLYSLLFSLPGAPVLYYGDEIGMGDNIYLGDRSAVRTPMQWSADRNGGFSDADFARLYAPPVTDPVYGYTSVNVDAEQRDPSSLLHWLRRLIALRRNTPTLARGSLELLEPANRKILAYVRRADPAACGLADAPIILVVANLARTVQPVELDLSAFAGLIPVEMIGRTPLPRIGNAPYFLTLGPHTFYWFQLQKTAEEVSARLAPVATEEIAELPQIEVSGGWETVLEGPARQALERDVLPHFLRAQRWFGGKARQVEAVRLADWGDLPGGPGRGFLALLEVAFADGKRDRYFVPLGVTAGADAARLLQSLRPWVLARLKGKAGTAVLHDALADDGACTALLDAIGAGREFTLRGGRVRGVPTAAFAALRGNPEHRLPVVRGPATSSNSLLFYGRRLLLKLFRRLEVGINPDFEIGRFLTERSPFERAPKVAGMLSCEGEGGGPFTLAILQALVPNQGDGWRHAIDELGRYFERASGRMHGPDPVAPDDRSLLELADSGPPPGAVETIGAYLHTAATLGQRTAEMHLALAADARDPAFAPEPFTPADLAALREDIAAQGRAAIKAKQDNLDRLPAEIAPQGRRLLELAPAVLERLHDAPPEGAGGEKIRVHGDYHLGQVLWVENDFVILDFEGEPTRSVEERRAKQSPLKDVAGMLRSFHYAAYAGLFAYTQNRPEDFARLGPWADLWHQWASAAFLRAYRARACSAAFLPGRPEEFAALLDAFLLDKAFYELVYELNNRPDWVRIPLKGILGLLEQGKEIPESARIGTN
jgi:maltose alpha-D-glucosyltransferase/alpha-amylase